MITAFPRTPLRLKRKEEANHGSHNRYVECAIKDTDYMTDDEEKAGSVAKSEKI